MLSRKAYRSIKDQKEEPMSSNIKKYGFKDGLALEIEIIPLAKTFAAQKADMIIPHRVDFYQVLWIQKGTPVHLVDFKPVKLKTNALLFINKERVHAFDPSGKYDGKGLLFTGDFFCQTEEDVRFLNTTILFNDLLDTPIISLDKSNPQLAVTFEEIAEELKKPKDHYQHSILQNLLHNFLLLAERERRKQGFHEIKKGADLDYTLLYKSLLHEHYQKIKSVSAYAKLINVSEKRLTKATSAILGQTPKELIDDKVLLEAKRLLAHTRLSIKEVAFELGFEEPTNFIKYFRKHLHKTPIEFRETYF